MTKQKHITVRFKVRSLNIWRDNKVLHKRISNHSFVDRCTDISIGFIADVELYQVNLVLDMLAQYGLTLDTFSLTGLKERDLQNLERTFKERLRDKASYNTLDFGPDVAEDEDDLAKYFLENN
ncbi:hypothetical protein ACFL5F_02555 [Planctomycetota bacterium]